MKKMLLLIVLTTITSWSFVRADDPQGGNSVLLSPKIDTPIGGHGGLQKDEPASILIDQLGHDLIFGEDYCCCMITLAFEDCIVYSTYVPATGTVSLPITLSGTFELVLYVGDVRFVGEITL